MDEPQPRVGVAGALVFAGRLLVVRRGHAPAAGRWGLPGGGVRLGEPLRDAVAREVREETGLRTRATALLDVVEVMEGAALTDPPLGERPGPAQTRGIGAPPGRDASDPDALHWVVVCFAVALDDPLPDPMPAAIAGSDALEARWATLREIDALPTAPGTLDLARKALASG